VTFAQYFANFGASQLFSAASVLIAVGVVLDTVRQLESQMVMRNYSGFLS
jgi:preprotein translocase subunit SecY